ncbi:MAG: aminotransferase class III-fold pyridoxal phosphate-dependent enzyme [Kordiimonadaceae bacterium]|jgi:4-aminobutyrate aminotransferase-like enzyme|nr:aminotransferase class III-fold pyridoxal phosphate-dependent enzyme [Kordiimonadaceae bacterium]
MTNTALWKRREKALGPTYTHFYDQPINIVKGEGVWLYDEKGNKYLDCYNNVVSVGHCNPRVVKALSDQAAILNTHTRYLHENVVALAEKLSSKFPEKLDTCIFVCTGTEANDLALQMSKAITGNEGVIVSDAAYHGNSMIMGAMDQRREDFGGANWLETFEPPNTYRNPEGTAESFADAAQAAITRLEDNGMGLAATMLDLSFDSNGILIAPDGYASLVVKKTHAAGGLVICDEVQAGYCRLGDHWWGFEKYGIMPDIVTLGKPMGAGHPVAAVVTTREIASKFAQIDSYFNTFGGNPVSAAVAKAVIDEIDDRELLKNVTDVGAYLKEGLDKIADKYDFVGSIQGSGLFWGLDLVKDATTKEPMSDSQLSQITTMIKDEGVLMGSTGRFDNILKIRPPLVFSKENADQALAAIEKVFSTL